MHLSLLMKKNKSFIINDELTKIYSGKAVSSSTDITVKWSENQGVLLDINPQNVWDESYSTNITWTLSDAP